MAIENLPKNWKTFNIQHSLVLKVEEATHYYPAMETYGPKLHSQ
jgi:hypothetical protein